MTSKGQSIKRSQSLYIARAKALPGETVLNYLRRHKLYLEAPCGGQGRCGKCLIRVIQGQAAKAEAFEAALIKQKSLEADWRLACCVCIADDLIVELPDQQLLDAFYDTQNISCNDCRPKKPDPTAEYGVAMDIGTTTVVLYLLDLHSGEKIAVKSFMNPQKVYGSDVISRIWHSNLDPENLQKLQQILAAGIDQGIKELLDQLQASPRQLVRLTAVGNTTMLHLLLGASVSGFAGQPFKPAFLAAQQVLAAQLGLNCHEKAILHTLPCISAFAGADLLAGMDICGLFDVSGAGDKARLLIDLGTNGEMALAKGESCLTCSTAVGPAFEGGRITWGVGSVPGAIDHVYLKEPNGTDDYSGTDDQLSWTTIGGLPPVGLCGSGLIDLVALLLDQGLLSPDGLLQENQAGQRYYTLDAASGIGLSQQDIRELQLAKAAVAAGIQSLLEVQALAYQDLAEVFLAGGFGTYINLDNAFRIGLFPEELRGKIRLAGNTAGAGACQALLCPEHYEELAKLASKGDIKYLDLALYNRFQEIFLQSINFPFSNGKDQ